MGGARVDGGAPSVPARALVALGALQRGEPRAGGRARAAGGDRAARADGGGGGRVCAQHGGLVAPAGPLLSHLRPRAGGRAPPA
eukprot:1128432-Prymnesium_polylepis.1